MNDNAVVLTISIPSDERADRACLYNVHVTHLSGDHPRGSIINPYPLTSAQDPL